MPHAQAPEHNPRNLRFWMIIQPMIIPLHWHLYNLGYDPASDVLLTSMNTSFHTTEKPSRKICSYFVK